MLIIGDVDFYLLFDFFTNIMILLDRIVSNTEFIGIAKPSDRK